MRPRGDGAVRPGDSPVGARPARLGAGTTQEAVRRHNLALALSYLHAEGQLSRVELTTRLGLNRSTIGALVGELVALGAVVETPPQEPARRAGAGRPSLDVRPDSEGLAVLAVDIGVQLLRVARIGLGGVIAAQIQVKTPPPFRPPEIAAKIAELAANIAPRSGKLLGISVVGPGVVQELEGVVRFAPNLKWRDIRFGDLLRAELALDIPITLGNDAHLGALAELTRGAARGRKNVVFLMADVGLGGGIVIDGKLVRGAGGFAGEWGHLHVNPRGRECRCGSTGCWETEVCAPAIARALSISQDQVAAALENIAHSNRQTRKLSAVVGYLGQGIGDIVNSLNPEVIVLAGLLAKIYRLFPRQVQSAMEKTSLNASREQVALITSSLGSAAVLIGAGERAFTPLLGDPARVLGDLAQPEIDLNAQASRASLPER